MRRRYYDNVLKHVNAMRAEFMMPPLDKLPRARRHGDFNHCAIGEAFELWDRTGAVRSANVNGGMLLDRDPVLADYEMDFEKRRLPEIEPLV
jgi:hypothetical protein